MTVFAPHPFDPKNPTRHTNTSKRPNSATAASNQSNTATNAKKRTRVLKGNQRYGETTQRPVSARLYPGTSTGTKLNTVTTPQKSTLLTSANISSLINSGTIKHLPSTPVQLDRSLQLERVMPQRTNVLNHPIDHCYDVQTRLQTPNHKIHAKWHTYCPHHDHLLNDATIRERIIPRRNGSYIYLLHRDKDALHVTEMHPVPNDIINGAVSGKYHTFWFLRDDPSAAYVTSLSQASVGQMGLGSTIREANFSVPQMIRFKRHEQQGNVNRIERIQIACGEMHSLFIVQGGKRFYACGSNLRGACGLGASRCIQEATRVRLPEGYIALHAGAGDSHSVIVARNENMFEMYDEIFVMGSAKSGAIGMPLVGGEEESSTKHRDNASTVSGETQHTTAAATPLVPDQDQPANPSKCWIRTPTRLQHSILSKKNFKGVVCGAQHTLLWSRTGEVYGMGQNESGCLGLGHEQPVHEPQVVFRCSSLNNESITHIACGASHSVIVTNYRTIYVAGSNTLYQLGLDHNIDVNTFTRLKHKIFDQKVIRHVRCGRHTTVIVTSDNCVYCFGGRFGELNESRYLRLSGKDEEIYDVTVENTVPMVILGKKLRKR